MPIFCIGVICFLPFVLEAKHIIGGEITYQYMYDVSPTVKHYLITLIVYRDCDSGGGQLDNPAKFAIYRGDMTGGNLVSEHDLSLEIETVDPVIPPCADINNLPVACVQKGTYTLEVDLPVLTDESYILEYQRCCRTEAIVNIESPGSYGATYMIELTAEAMANNNSSPSFVNYPPGFICNNFLFKFDHRAFDIDGDSLVYSYCTPLHGGGSSNGGGGGSNCNSPTPNPPCPPPFDQVIFLPGYSDSIPMVGNPAVSISRDSGFMIGRPSGIGQYVVGICVQEYRNGQLLSTVLRDFQFNVVDCVPGVVADVQEDELLGPKHFLIRSCGEKNVAIINQSPQNTAQQTTNWIFDLKNGTTFTTSTYNTTVPFPEYGEYKGILYLNTGFECADTGYLTVRVFPPITANFEYGYDSCAFSPVQFKDLSVAEAASGIVSWAWEFGVNGAVSSLQNPDYQYPLIGSYAARLKVTDGNDCSSEAARIVQWLPKPLPYMPSTGAWRVCFPAPVEFDFLDSIDLTGTNVLWDFGDGNQSEEISPAHVYAQNDSFTVALTYTNDYDCFLSDTFYNKVIISPKPVVNFDYAPRKLSNLENTTTFTDKSDSGVEWIWEFGNGDGRRAQETAYTFSDTGLIPIKLTVMNEFGCFDSLTKIIDVVPMVRLYVPNVFSPSATNGLGNDRFGAVGIIPGYRDYQIRIWSRWGELLFESKDPEEGWDGYRRGSSKPMPSGAYLYEIDMVGPRGEPYRWDGTVTIL